MLPFWWPHRLLLQARQVAYDRGMWPRARLPVPVIGVGNLSLGGTGKTPLVHWLAEWGRQAGWRPAVISRGYRAGADGRNEEADLTDCSTFCDPDRFAAGQAALAAGHNLLIGDDLFQHRRVQRDVDLVLIDATRPWGWASGRRGQVLPLGFLREAPAALQRADALIISRCDQVAPARLALLQRQLRRIGRPVWRAWHQVSGLRPFGSTVWHGADHLQQQEVWLLSGIAHPEAFTASCRQCGMRVQGHSVFPDHHHFSRSDLQRARRQAGSRPLICTSKDLVKLQRLDAGAMDLWELAVVFRFADDDGSAVAALLQERLRRWQSRSRS